MQLGAIFSRRLWLEAFKVVQKQPMMIFLLKKVFFDDDDATMTT